MMLPVLEKRSIFPVDLVELGFVFGVKLLYPVTVLLFLGVPMKEFPFFRDEIGVILVEVVVPAIDGVSVFADVTLVFGVPTDGLAWNELEDVSVPTDPELDVVDDVGRYDVIALVLTMAVGSLLLDVPLILPN